VITVARLLHTPVKGLALAERESLELGLEGAPFDRRFFVVNAAGELAGSWSHGRLALTAAEYDGSTLTMRFPDGTVASAPDPVLGEPIDLIWDSDEPETAHLIDGPWAEPLSEVLGEPVRLARIREGRGGWSANAVSLIGEASIDALGHGAIGDRRFRMTMTLTGGEAFEEDSWIGNDVAIGDAVLAVRVPCERCVATTRDPATGEKDVPTLRAMKATRGRPDLGVYCDVVTPGTVRLGDEVRVLGPSA
jgi:uncharacterized protein YcbX